MPPAKELHPCQPGHIIAKKDTIQPYFKQIKQLISAPQDIYEELYLATLHRFCELCQSMPFSIQEPLLPYSLITQQLELTIAALKLRRGKMLPPNADSETIAAQEPLWTYAIFTTCLFTQIERIQADRTIMLYKSEQEQLGVWHPLAGTLFEPDTYYTVLAKSPEIMVQPNLFKATLIGKMIPSVALRWLTAAHSIFTVWQEALTEENPGNLLSTLSTKAAEKIHYPLN